MEGIYADIKQLASVIVEKCKEHGLKISTAESCTGGMISGAITSVSGSSSVIELGICSYSNRIKRDILGVSEETLDRYSEYSIQCAEEMARGALKLSGADFAVSTSGVAGPSGGSPENPVGTVYISVCGRNRTLSEKYVFEDRGRNQIRAAATEQSLNMLLGMLTEITSL